MEPRFPSQEEGVNRKRAALAIVPFLVLGVANAIFILFMGLEPLWGFLILPPILFVCVIGWLAFKGGFVENRGMDEDY